MDYLKPGLLGLDPDRIGAKDWAGRLEQSGRSEFGMLVVKCLQHNQILPPDLLRPELSGSRCDKARSSPCLTSTDHFATKANEFDPKYVVVAIGELHDALDLAFREAVTDEALIRWRKGGIQMNEQKYSVIDVSGPISPPYILRCGALE